MGLYKMARRRKVTKTFWHNGKRIVTFYARDKDRKKKRMTIIGRRRISMDKSIEMVERNVKASFLKVKSDVQYVKALLLSLAKRMDALENELRGMRKK